MAWVVKRTKLNFKKGFFWDTLMIIQILYDPKPINLPTADVVLTKKRISAAQSKMQKSQTWKRIKLAKECQPG